MAPKVLVVLSSQATITVDGKSKASGWYLSEFAHPYDVLITSGAEIEVASPQGGEAPLDPSSIEAAKSDSVSTSFHEKQSALWKNTSKLSSYKGRAGEFAAIFYVGGHGPMFDLADDETSHAVIREFWEAGKVVSAVCHGPAALAKAKLADGSYLIDGSPVTAFSNAEEEKLGTAGEMPFPLESELVKNGAKFEKADLWQEKVVVGRDGRLITGQNPASAAGVGKSIAKAISV